MAGKSARLRDKRRGPDAADADAAAIRELIDGDGSGDGVREGDGSGRDDQNNASGSEGDGGIGAGNGASGIGSPGDDDHRDGTGDRTGTGSAAGSSTARTGKRTRTAAREEAESVRETVSRSVKAPNKTKGVIETETFSLGDSAKELIGDFYSVVFWMIGQATSVPEWALDDDDAEVLGEKTEKFVKSLGKRRATNLMKSLGKVGPALGFGGALAMATVPRIKLTIQRAKNVTPQSVPRAIETEGNSGSSNTAPASDQSTSNGASNVSPAGLSERPFAASDFREIVPGYGREDAGEDAS